MSGSWNKVAHCNLNNYDMIIMVGLYTEWLSFTNLPLATWQKAWWPQQSPHDCLKESSQSLYSFAISKEGQRTMNCLIQALSILLFAIVCSDDIAAPREEVKRK